MTQQELAKALGLHQSTVSRYLRRGMPDDPAGARAWIRGNVRLTIKAPAFRQATTAHRPAPPPPRQEPTYTPSELFDEAVCMIDVLREMDSADPEFDRGCYLLLNALLRRLPEAMLSAVLMPPPVWARVEAQIEAFEAEDAAP